MSLMERIKVKTCYTRATNVERDAGCAANICTYHPTARGVAVLEDVAAAFAKGNQPRAWSLIGPYGAGKSTFAVFLHALLGANGEAATAEALKVLGKQHRRLANRFRRQKPWCRVVLTGSPETLSRRLLKAMDAAASTFWEGRPGRKPQVLARIREACSAPQMAERDLLSLVDDLQDALERIGTGGLLFVIDELGKFLEFEAGQRSGHIGSTYLLQELAERTYLGRKANLLLFTLQHQAFDMYASGMGEQLQNEWAKVQGRYQMVSFIETTEQTLRVLSRAFEHCLTPAEQARIARMAAKSATELAEANALPVGLERDAAAELFAACYPVHPVALLALPMLCTRFAQNERTLFTYFGSSEPHGFQQAAAGLQRVGEWVLPCSVYDYFVQTPPPVGPLVQRTWAEVATAVDRAEREDQQCVAAGENGTISLVQLVKAVGLLNLTAGSQGLPASEAALAQLYPSKAALQDALAGPMAASILCYRKFANEYRVWQGTDFNIDEHLTRERDKLGRIDLARVLTERGEAMPIVARRHSIEFGALRAFEIVYVDAESQAPRESGGTKPRLVVFLAENRADEAAFHSARENAQASEVWALHRSGAALRTAIGDVLALERVQSKLPNEEADLVPHREVGSRLARTRTTERQALDALLRRPSGSKWYYGGERLEVPDRLGLQRVLSDVLDRLYSVSPKIRQDLVNRDRLSAAAVAARNRLLGHMLDGGDQVALGIAGHPLERAIYQALFERGGLHRQDETGQWSLARPADADPLNLKPAYERLDALFEESETEPVSARQVIDELAEPPLGVKRGVSPILLLHYYLLKHDEVAFYDESGYAPALTVEKMQRLLARPDLASFRQFRAQGNRAELFDEYSAKLFGGSRQPLNAVGIAKPLVRFVFGLDDYSLRTGRVSETAVKVRQAIRASKSAQELVFRDLPAACGLAEGAEPAMLAEAVASALRELGAVRPALLEDMRAAVAACFGVDAGADVQELREAASAKCEGWSYRSDDELQQFIAAAVASEPADDEWFEGLLAVLGEGPSRSWVDGVDLVVKAKLAAHAQSLLDWQLLRSHEDALTREGREKVDLILVGVKRAGSDALRMVVPLERVPSKQFTECLDAVREVVEGVEEERRLPLLAGLLEDGVHALAAHDKIAP